MSYKFEIGELVVKNDGWEAKTAYTIRNRKKDQSGEYYLISPAGYVSSDETEYSSDELLKG